MSMKPGVLLLLASCAGAGSSPPAQPAAAPSQTDPRVRFTGTITDMDFGCWADKACGVKVDGVWIMLASRLSGDRGPSGSFVGIEWTGAPADALKARYVGTRAEVFAEKTPVIDPSGAIRYDDTRLTLGGSADYFVRVAR